MLSIETLLICFAHICFVSVLLQRAVETAWRWPISIQGERALSKMQNASLLCLKVNQTSGTPASFDWQIRAMEAKCSERNNTGAVVSLFSSSHIREPSPTTKWRFGQMKPFSTDASLFTSSCFDQSTQTWNLASITLRDFYVIRCGTSETPTTNDLKWYFSSSVTISCF